MQESRRHTRFLKFLLVGLFNTLVGVAVIVGGILIGLPPLIANALGFVVGLCVSFTLNSRITFRVAHSSGWTAFRYLLAFLTAYGCNLVVVLLLERMYPQHVILTHVLGIVPYTIVFFLLADTFVFRQTKARDVLVDRADGL